MLPPLLAIVAIAGTSAPLAQTKDATTTTPRTIVFVCEHGAARSVMAAAYFNKLAAERRLNARAIARGVTPQADLSTSAIAGLQKDGVAYPTDKPQALTESEVRRAGRVVAFCPLPQSWSTLTRTDTFEVPGPADGYEKSRDAILVHVRALVDEIAAAERGQKRPQ